jgi:predicted enzyme related to lactoylglutathione lyase
MFQMDKQSCGGETGEMPPPHWMSYIAVDDVDTSAAKVWELGGKVCVPPTDIPNVGRFCVVNDPTGATFSLITLKAPQ